MKQIRPLISGLIACGIAMAMITSAAAQTAQDGTVKVVNVKGSARYMMSANSTWQPLKVGTMLKPGAIVQTASGSFVDLVMNNPAVVESGGGSASDVAYYHPKAEQDALRLFENTVLAIDKLTVEQTGSDQVTETQLDLKHGRIFGTVKKLSAASKYEVKIPNGVAGIRGTIFYLSSDGVLTVLTGSVVLAWVGSDGTPVTQVVTGGQQFDAKTGQITSIPEPMLKEMIRLAKIFRFGPNTPPTIFTVDHTVYYVSPTQGQNGLGGGGGGIGAPALAGR